MLGAVNLVERTIGEPCLHSILFPYLLWCHGLPMLALLFRVKDSHRCSSCFISLECYGHRQWSFIVLVFKGHIIQKTQIKSLVLMYSFLFHR
jgi:hypothetical protein